MGTSREDGGQGDSPDDNGNDVAPLSEELAKKRTHLARDRTSLAAERTFTAWLRTGLAATGAGVGIAELIRASPRVLTLTIGIILLLAAGISYGLAFWRYRQESSMLRPAGARMISLALMSVLIIALLATVVLSLILLSRALIDAGATSGA